MKEIKPKTLPEFKTKAKALGYKVTKQSNERIGEFFIAERKDVGEMMGSFCPRYPRDAFLFINA